ncbi:FkbM family methyltransferase [Thermofilum pendens]|uniref:Methyltransferase FkbM family n=1 Tax=Thermofilum pendens (strain DSM 2475 / Hrk 5) TaxID=368408 RepID=A1S0Y1_THEPD|nr:FkbM family methyltransferase [Thermofilum pendens]ABL79111.1 methyltransferase FkbM family [Thermofilum pendens Hrk 5]
MKRRLGLVAGRVFLWMRIFRSFRGLTFRSAVNIPLSAAVDLLASLVTTPSNPRMLFSGFYLVKELGVVVFVRGGTEDLYYLLPGREGPVDEFIRSALSPGDVFVDVGANVGYYTLLGVLRGARVVAMEPVPQTVAVLKANLRLNGFSGVIVVDKCAWSTRGRVTLFVPSGRYYGLSSAYHDRGVKGSLVGVEAVRLDDVLRGFDRIRLVKLDVEGAEYDVLKGMESVLERVDFIVVEVSRRAKDIICLLKSHGFKVRRMGFTTYVLAQRISSSH